MFENREVAGRALAKALAHLRGSDTMVYALPRGGSVVGKVVAKELGCPLELIITRKIGHPFNDEYAVCAITEEGTLICDEEERAKLDPDWLDEAVSIAQTEAARRKEVYRGKEPRRLAKGKTAIVVDDGVATGLTLYAALASLKNDGAARTIVAVPACPPEAAASLRERADAVIILTEDTEYLGAVGAYYRSFAQVTDEEVIAALQEGNRQD